MKSRDYIIICAVTILSSFLLWLPFVLHLPSLLAIPIKDSNFLHYIVSNFDGALYIIPAKTWYDPQLIQLPWEGLTKIYFAAHLPLYPVFIKLFSFLIGYTKSLIFTNVLFTSILASFFYFLVKTFNITKQPLTLTLVFLFLPRFLVLRSIGAPESLFLFLILASLFFFEKKQYLYAGLLGGLATMTKVPGILLFPAYLLVFIEHYLKVKKIEWQSIFILLIPTGLLAVCTLYAVQYHDFWAFFHTGGVVPMSYPFSAFNLSAKWVQTGWIEEIVFYFFIYTYSAITLYKSKYRSFFYFTLVFLIGTSLVQHRDIARYSVPLWPMACIACEEFLTNKKTIYSLLFISPAIYLYAFNFIVFNIAPIADWAPFI